MKIIEIRQSKPPYSEFYEAHYHRAVYYIYKKIGNYEDAEDLASDVFMYCYTHYEDYNPDKSSLSTWLYLVVNSRIKNYYRDSKTNVDLETIIGVLPDDNVDLDACVFLQQMREQLEKAIKTLPPRQQQIVTMRFFEEKDNAEIADALNMTNVNVRVQLSRALDSLEKKCSNLLEGMK